MLFTVAMETIQIAENIAGGAGEGRTMSDHNIPRTYFADCLGTMDRSHLICANNNLGRSARAEVNLRQQQQER